jgi:hypothetical protein
MIERLCSLLGKQLNRRAESPSLFAQASSRSRGSTLNTYHYVLYVHFLSLFVGIGAGSVLLACLLQLRAARTVEQAAPWGMLAGKVGKLFPVAIIGLFGSGAYLTSETTLPWTWGTRWVDVGIAALVVLTVQGAGIAERTGHKLGAALQANGPGPLGPEARRMALHPGLWVVEFSNLGIVFGVVWNMTQKPGLGGSIAAVLVGYAVGAALALVVTRSAKEELAPASRPAA